MIIAFAPFRGEGTIPLQAEGFREMNRDAAFALAMLIFSGIAFAETFRFPEGSPFRVGPEVYPRYVLAVLGGLSALLLGRSLASGIAMRWADFDGPAFVEHYWRSAAIFAIFGIYAVFLPVAGFPVATAVFLSVLQVLLAPRLTPIRLALILALSIGATALTFFVFTEVLRVFLP